VSSSHRSDCAARANRRGRKANDGDDQSAQKRDDQYRPDRKDWGPEAMIQRNGCHHRGSIRRTAQTGNLPHRSEAPNMAPIPDPIRRDASTPQKRDDQCDPNRRDWAPEAMVQGSGRSRETCPTEVRHLSMAPIPDPIRRDAAAPQKRGPRTWPAIPGPMR